MKKILTALAFILFLGGSIQAQGTEKQEADLFYGFHVGMTVQAAIDNITDKGFVTDIDDLNELTYQLSETRSVTFIDDEDTTSRLYLHTSRDKRFIDNIKIDYSGHYNQGCGTFLMEYNQLESDMKYIYLPKKSGEGTVAYDELTEDEICETGKEKDHAMAYIIFRKEGEWASLCAIKKDNIPYYTIDLNYRY